jgi:hypothetical protein
MSTLHFGAFEMHGVTGITLARGGDAAGIRLAYPHVSLGLCDEKFPLLTLDAPTTYAPDLGYVCYAWRYPVTLAGIKRLAGWPCIPTNSPTVVDFAPGEATRVTLEWAVVEGVAVGRYTSEAPLRVGLIVNGSFAPGLVEEASPTRCRLTQGGVHLGVILSGSTDAPLLVDTRQQAEKAWYGLAAADGRAMALYPVTLAPETPLYVVLGDADHPPVSSPLPAAIDRALATGKRAYEAARMRSTGICAGGAEAVAGLSGYGRAYDPKRDSLQMSVNRTWAGPNRPGLVFGWDNFFCAYLAAWENPALGADALAHIAGVYGERAISEGPTQRNLIIPLMYCRTLDLLGDEALARQTWPAMRAFMRFWFADRGDGHPWRDGNDDGLIESGTNVTAAHHSPGRIIQDAMDETGYDELPLVSAGFTEGRLGMLAADVEFDWHRGTLSVTEVGQNSLYCAAGRAMAWWADRLGFAADAAWLRAEVARVTERMQDRLFDPTTGIYRDRLGTGAFSPVKTMTLFYPLLAGLAEEEVKARLEGMLRDPAQFWGENLIPTVSRDDPAYCDGIDRQGNYWRGNCWPPTTYIVYLAIKEAGWDALAAEYARRVSAQFLDSWTRWGHAYENYPPEGAVDHTYPYVNGWGGREVRYIWAAMMPLCALEELFAPEMIRPGVRFGNPYLAEETSWRGFFYRGALVDAVAGPAQTRVQLQDGWAFSAQPGVAVRAFHIESGAFHFSTAAPHDVTVRLGDRRLTSATGVTCDGLLLAAAASAGTVTFTLPAGGHTVVVSA